MSRCRYGQSATANASAGCFDTTLVQLDYLTVREVIFWYPCAESVTHRRGAKSQKQLPFESSLANGLFRFAEAINQNTEPIERRDSIRRVRSLWRLWRRVHWVFENEREN